MPSTEWFYSRGSKRFGPVSPSELKQLAHHGELSPDELVWREGMEQWIPARRVKGLFDEGTVPVKEIKEEPPVSAVPPHDESMAGRSDVSRGIEPTPPPPPADRLSAPIADRLSAPRLPQRTFEVSASAFERAREGASRHLFDVLLEAARGVFDANFLRATATLFAAAGHYALYAAIALLVGIHAVLAIWRESLVAALFGLGVAALLAVFQYSARRIAGVLEWLDTAAVDRMPSPAFLDCCALVGFVGSLMALVGVTVFAVSTQQFGWIFWAIALFIFLEHFAVLALNPESLGLTLAAEITAGEEAIGVMVFFLKVGLRAAPLVFGIGVFWGVSLLIYAAAMLLEPRIGDHAAILTGLGLFGPEIWNDWTSTPVQAVAVQGAGALLIAGASPLVAYFVILAGHLAIELLRAVLGIPEKLDLVAEGKKPGDMMS